MQEDLYLQLRYRFDNEEDVINVIAAALFRKTIWLIGIEVFLLLYSVTARFVPLPHIGNYADIIIFALFLALTIIMPYAYAALMMPSVRNAAIQNDSLLSLYQTYFTEESAEGVLRYDYSAIKRVTVTKKAVTINAGSFNSFIPAAAFSGISLSQVLAFMQSKGADIPADVILKADEIINK